jgi:uncharacterized membrane protein YsdA (DUF1294 family)
MGRPEARRRPFRFHLMLAAFLIVAGTVLLWLGLSRQNDALHWLGCWLVAANVVAFGYYGYDKARARAASSRVPEVVLHVLSAAGGSVGAYAAMHLFRHKTVKGKFRILFWCIVVLQVLLALWVAKMVWWS